MERDARLYDRGAWALLEAQLQRRILIWDYIEWKLRTVLSTTRQIGKHGHMAGWDWWKKGTLCRGWLCVEHCSDANQQRPFVRGEAIEWWPIIWLIMEADPNCPVVPMFCPALAWSNSRPWSVHTSRLGRCPPAWLDGFFADDISSSGGGTSIISSTTSSWMFVPSTAPSICGWEIVIAGDADVANMSDVDDADTIISSTAASSSAAASSASTAASSSDQPIQRRWGNKQKEK